MPESVPTVPELAHIGEAWVVAGGSTYHVSDAGHRRMGDAMRRNALEALDQKGKTDGTL